MRVTAEELREILSVARKLRVSAQEEIDEDYVDLFLRAAAALEDRARQLAFNPFDPRPLHIEIPDVEAARHQPVDLVC